MSSEPTADRDILARALAVAGTNDRLRNVVFDALRRAENEAADPGRFREQVRWPLIRSLLGRVEAHRVILANGLLVDVSPDSRIEKALLLSTEAHPDHVWEPQTTKLLMALSVKASNVIIGGAYIGDHVLFVAQVLAQSVPPGTVHAFEPFPQSFDRLLHHLTINKLSNVVAHPHGLWDRSHIALQLRGDPALASSAPVGAHGQTDAHVIASVSIDNYVNEHQLSSVELIMLDTEGAEERALLGARHTLTRHSPNIVFEIHRNFVDWTEGLAATSVVSLLTGLGYQVFAIRDFHDNYPMPTQPIEIIPIDAVYLQGPPHGFNLLATRSSDLVGRLGLKIVKHVSPKLLAGGNPALHWPLCAHC